MAKFLISAFADEASEDLDLQIAALKRNGVRCIEPRSVNGNMVKKTDEELEEIAKKLRDNGISLSSLGSPIGKFSIDEDFEIHMEEFRRAIRACEILGTKNMRMFSFFVEPERYAECRDEVIRRLKIMLEEAKKHGITLCHENESKIYGQNPPEVKDLLTALPELKGIFDAANFIRNKQDSIEGFEATLPSLEYIHVKDAVAETRAILPAGMGEGKYDEVIDRTDKATDKLIYLTVEPHLFKFIGYDKIDKTSLNIGMHFETSDEAFDFAVTKLKEVLTGLGFKEGEDKVWTR